MAKYTMGKVRFNDIRGTIGYGKYGIWIYKDSFTIAKFHGDNPVKLEEKAKKHINEMEKLPPLKKEKY